MAGSAFKRERKELFLKTELFENDDVMMIT